MKFFTKPFTIIKNALRGFLRVLSVPQDELRIPLYWTLLLLVFFLLLVASMTYNALLALSSLKEDTQEESNPHVGIVNRGDVYNLVEAIDLRAREYEARQSEVLEISDPAE